MCLKAFVLAALPPPALPPTWSMIKSKAKYSTKNLQLCFMAAPYLFRGKQCVQGEGSGAGFRPSQGAGTPVQAGRQHRRGKQQQCMSAHCSRRPKHDMKLEPRGPGP